MATINLGNDSPTEGEVRNVDLKQATVHVQPITLDTPSSTPATTPDQNSPSDEVMAGKKVFSLERPTDKARELASKLTLEEQVRKFLLFAGRSLEPLSVNLELDRRHNI
jgi:beta-glucosidase